MDFLFMGKDYFNIKRVLSIKCLIHFLRIFPILSKSASPQRCGFMNCCLSDAHTCMLKFLRHCFSLMPLPLLAQDLPLDWSHPAVIIPHANSLISNRQNVHLPIICTIFSLMDLPAIANIPSVAPDLFLVQYHDSVKEISGDKETNVIMLNNCSPVVFNLYRC